MTVVDCLTMVALVGGPIIAVQLTRFLDEKREERRRKLDVFKRLMATRGYLASWDHVEALNRIDLEFRTYREDERAVVNAWKQYLDLLSSRGMPSEQWEVKRVDLLVEMLYQMAVVLKYKFDKTHIKNLFYSPTAHGTLELEQASIRKYALEVLEGKRAVRITAGDGPIHVC